MKSNRKASKPSTRYQSRLPRPKVTKTNKTIDVTEINSKFTPSTPTQIRADTRQTILQANKILQTSTNKIALITAPTGSGKTHSVIEEVKLRFGAKLLSSKIAICLPTRANVFNLGELSRHLDASFGMHVGGEGGDYTNPNDNGVIYTYGKLFEMLKFDPLLSQFEELIFDEADILSSGQEIRWIPVIKWLLVNRPELKIILMSATLDIEGYKELFDVTDELIFDNPGLSRPRPIQSLYITDQAARERSLTHPINSNSYMSTTIDAVEAVIEGKNPLTPGEVGLVFLPTISSVERVAQKIASKYEDQVEVRILHSKKLKEDLESDILTPIEKGKIGIMVATDIIGRGINFSDELLINRVIHSGLSNRRIYNQVTRRDILTVDYASTNDITQAFGRAGRSMKDVRRVVGLCLQPIKNLKKNLSASLNSTDPTQMILQTSRVLKKIKTLKRAKSIPASLQEFINPVVVDESRIRIAIEKLKSLDAIDLNENITDFGTFLIDINMDLDYGMMIYQALGTNYLRELCDILSLASKTSYLIDFTTKNFYIEYTKRLAKSHGVNNDLMVLSRILSSVETLEDASHIGINFLVLQEARLASLQLQKSLKTMGHKINIIDEPIDDYLSGIALNALTDSLLMFKKKYGRNGVQYMDYLHLASNSIFTLSPSSICNINQSKYIVSTNCASVGGVITATEAIPVDPSTYMGSNWILSRQIGAVNEFDPKTGKGSIQSNLTFKGYVKETVLESVDIDFEGGKEASQALAIHLVNNSGLFPFLNVNIDTLNRIMTYQTTIINPKETLIRFYSKLLIDSNITTIQAIKPMVLKLEYIVTSDQAKQINKHYPTRVFDYEVKYIEIKTKSYAPVIELTPQELLDKPLITSISKKFTHKVYTNIATPRYKPEYKPISEASTKKAKSTLTIALNLALEQHQESELGALNDFASVPELPSPIQYAVDPHSNLPLFIYPYIIIDYNSKAILHWADRKNSSNQELSRISKAISSQEFNLAAKELILSQKPDELLAKLLASCGNNSLDHDYIEKKTLLESIRSNINHPSLASQVNKIITELEQEIEYTIRGKTGLLTIQDSFKQFNTKYHNKRSDGHNYKLMVDKQRIAYTTEQEGITKSSLNYQVVDHLSKVLNNYVNIKFKTISEELFDK
jgi:superfamily II DNA/RNA helicase